MSICRKRVGRMVTAHPLSSLFLDDANTRKWKLINEQLKKSAKYPKLGTCIYLLSSPLHLESFIRLNCAFIRVALIALEIKPSPVVMTHIVLHNLARDQDRNRPVLSPVWPHSALCLSLYRACPELLAGSFFHELLYTLVLKLQTQAFLPIIQFLFHLLPRDVLDGPLCVALRGPVSSVRLVAIWKYNFLTVLFTESACYGRWGLLLAVLITQWSEVT